jgi:cell wall-associated NlpC family hydrolase
MNWSNEYIGIPFENKGRDREGCDCYGLVLLIYKEQYKIILPTIDEYKDALDKKDINKYVDKYQPIIQGTKLEKPEEGAIVLLGSESLSDHVGVVLSDNMMIHTTEELGVVVEELSSTRIRNKIKGYYNVNKRFYTE